MDHCSRRVAIATLLFSGSTPRAATPASGEAAREMVHLSNSFRSREGLPALRPDRALAHAARTFAEYMSQTDRYGHDADGRQPVQRAEQAGYVYCTVAENIAWHLSSRGISHSALAQTFVQGWIESPPHRRNLLAPEVTDIAIAVAQSTGSGRWYAVQMLGRPASLRARLELSNASRQGIRYRVDGRAFSLASGSKRWHEWCAAPRVEVDLPGALGPTALNLNGGARFQVDNEGQLRQLP